MSGRRVTPESSEFHIGHKSLTARVCSLLTPFAEVMAGGNAVIHGNLPFLGT